MTLLPPADAERIVRPRKSTADWRPVIAMSRDVIVVESMGEEVFASEDLGKILYSVPPSIIVVQGFGEHLQRLRHQFQDHPGFNYRVTPLKRYSRPWSDGTKLKPGMIVDAVCNFVGWKTEGHAANIYHYPLDPLWFLTTGIDDLNDDTWLPRIAKLYKWGKEVRDWCHQNGLKVTPSSGGIAAQLLRDSRFYPNPRRKAPRGINDSARSRLPGNYYQLRPTTEKHKPYRAIYLDMENAHHALAQRIRFPDANSLHAYGDWSQTARIDDDSPTVTGGRNPRAWRGGTSNVLVRPGIFHIRLAVPHIPSQFFPPPYMRSAGVRDCFVYSNELELIRTLGGQVETVHAAYVSHQAEPRGTGLNAYAAYAVAEIRANRAYRPWLKPVLHSTYGLLAARPQPFETGYFRAKSGDTVMYPMGNVSIQADAKVREAEIESRIANVIHRGMIEAEVRKQALCYARQLEELDGHRVLAIYADGIFLEDTGREVRLLEYPWRIKETVTSLRFSSATTFTSSSINRLPGVPRNARARYLQTRELTRNLQDKGPSESARVHARTEAERAFLLS